MMSLPKIVLMCAGESAYPTLQLLLLEKYLSAVVCVGKQDGSHVVQEVCEEQKLPVFMLSSKKELNALKSWLEGLDANTIFCVGFPYLLPMEILTIYAGRCFNFHMGVLPEYRGPMPIFETLRSAEKETAVTVHQMTASFDEGDVVFEDRFYLDAGETFGSLALKFAERISLASQNLAQMLSFGNSLPLKKQEGAFASFFNYPDKFETTIKWKSMCSSDVEHLVNACNPWNQGADTLLHGKPLKLVSVQFSKEQHDDVEAGTILQLELGKPVLVACLDGEVLAVDIVSSAWGIEPAQKLFSRIAHVGDVLGANQKLNKTNRLKNRVESTTE